MKWKHRKDGLSCEKLRERVSYDPLTGIFIWLTNRTNRHLIGKRAGGLNPDGYRLIKINGCKYFCSHLAWLYMTGEWPPDEVDHRNTIRDDDRFDNLRLSSRSSNCVNKNSYANPSSSGYRGVYLRESGRFAAYIGIHRRQVHLGTFDSAEDAARAYDTAAIQYHGEFARQNFGDHK